MRGGDALDRGQAPPELGLEVTGLITSGDSAGGNLTIVTTMALRDNPAHVPVMAQHPIYPVVTLDADWPSMRDFADGLSADQPKAMAYFAMGLWSGDYTR